MKKYLFFISVFILIGCVNKTESSINEFSQDEIKKLVEQAATASDLDISDKVITLEKNDKYIILMDKDGFIFIDLTSPEVKSYRLKKELQTESSSINETEENTTVEEDKKIVNVRKHGNHWHVTMDDGSEFITFKDPSGNKTSKNIDDKIEVVKNVDNSKKEVSRYLHGDHWHVKYEDGSESIIYVSGNNTNNSSNIKNSDGVFEKVIDHGEHIHVWHGGKEYSINKTMYEEFVSSGKFDENKALGKDNKSILENTDEKIKKEIEYISEVYNVPVEAIKYSEEYYVFNDPSHAYDPSHIHPYYINRKRFVIPEVTGIDEIDFENELIALAHLNNIPINQIGIFDDKFVLSHGSHDHYVKIKTKNYNEYFDNKLPAIQGKYIEGDFDETLILNKIDELLNSSESKFTDIVVKRRISRALLDLKQSIKSGKSNSTQGYLEMLDTFNKKYILLEDIDVVVDEVTQKYYDLINKVNSKPDNFFNMGITKETIIEEINKNQNELSNLKRYEHIINELEKFEARKNIVTIGYAKYLIENVQSTYISNELREEISELIVYLNSGMFNIDNDRVFQLISLKIKVFDSLNKKEEFEIVEGEHYFNLIINHFTNASEFVDGVSDMAEELTFPDSL